MNASGLKEYMQPFFDKKKIEEK